MYAVPGIVPELRGIARNCTPVHRPNTTLRDVMRMSGDHYARQTSHYLMLRDDLMVVTKNLVYVPRNPREPR
jgi:hypothetical protein